MSVEQTTVIDAIGVDNDTRDVVLTISDHLEWGNNEHLLTLQEKLNTYLRFVESGEIYDTYADAKGRSILISVVCKYPPDENATSFLNQVSDIVKNSGVEFKFHLFNK